MSKISGGVWAPFLTRALTAPRHIQRRRTAICASKPRAKKFVKSKRRVFRYFRTSLQEAAHPAANPRLSPARAFTCGLRGRCCFGWSGCRPCAYPRARRPFRSNNIRRCLGGISRFQPTARPCRRAATFGKCQAMPAHAAGPRIYNPPPRRLPQIHTPYGRNPSGD